VSNLARIYGALCKTAFLNSANPPPFRPPCDSRLSRGGTRGGGGRIRQRACTRIVATFMLINPFYPQTKYFGPAPRGWLPCALSGTAEFSAASCFTSPLYRVMSARARGAITRRDTLLSHRALLHISAGDEPREVHENIFIYLDCRGVTAAQCKSTRNRYKFSYELVK